MGDVDYFLRTTCTCNRQDDGHVSVRLAQTAFTKFTDHRFAVGRMSRVPNMTPYRSGLPINTIPSLDAKDPDLKCRTKVY